MNTQSLAWLVAFLMLSSMVSAQKTYRLDQYFRHVDKKEASTRYFYGKFSKTDHYYRTIEKEGKSFLATIYTMEGHMVRKRWYATKKDAKKQRQRMEEKIYAKDSLLIEHSWEVDRKSYRETYDYAEDRSLQSTKFYHSTGRGFYYYYPDGNVKAVWQNDSIKWLSPDGKLTALLTKQSRSFYSSPDTGDYAYTPLERFKDEGTEKGWFDDSTQQHFSKPLNLDEVKKKIGYPRIAADVGIQGRVKVQLLVDTQGVPSFFTLCCSDSPLFHRAVMMHALDLRFDPLVIDGEKRPFAVSVPFAFKLRD
ncbi:MAG: energy transducer TonB [Bacteroidota bacterium]